MDVNSHIRAVKAHPDFSKAGMILCHNGVVRSFSRDGRPVTGLEVEVDEKGLEDLIAAQKKRPGIVDVRVEIASGRPLSVGDDVMVLVVAGDVRENVTTVLKETLEAVKTRITKKTEFFAE